jgi:hypothetical protein
MRVTLGSGVGQTRNDDFGTVSDEQYNGTRISYHSTTVNVDRGIGKCVQEKPIIGLLGVSDMLTEIVRVLDSIECRWVVDRE